MKAVHRTDIDTVCIFAANTFFSDNIGHRDGTIVKCMNDSLKDQYRQGWCAEILVISGVYGWDGDELL